MDTDRPMINAEEQTECMDIKSERNLPNIPIPCLLFDLTSQIVKILDPKELLNSKNLLPQRPCLLYLQVCNKETIEIVFQEYKLNPLIQAECCEWSFKEKDYVMVFDNYFFIALSDVSFSEVFDCPIQVKMIVFPDMILILSFEPVFFVEHLFKSILNYKHYPNDPIFNQENTFSDFIWDSPQKTKIERKIHIENSSSIRVILFKVFEIIINRYEFFVYRMVKESRTCMCFSTEISYKERAEYQVRLNNAERNLIFLGILVKPKIKILNRLLNIYKDEVGFQFYLLGLSGRIKKAKELMSTSKKLLANAKKLYHTCAEDTLTRSSFSAGEKMKFFSGLSTIVVPLILVEGLWSTNIMIPGGQINNLQPFYMILGVSCLWIIFCILYFKKIGWF